MGKRTFSVTLTKTVILELDESVINVVDDEWRSQFYNIHTPEEIAEMIGRNMIYGARLSNLDGWGDQPDENAVIETVDVETEAREIL